MSQAYSQLTYEERIEIKADRRQLSVHTGDNLNSWSSAGEGGRVSRQTRFPVFSPDSTPVKCLRNLPVVNGFRPVVPCSHVVYGLRMKMCFGHYSP